MVDPSMSGFPNDMNEEEQLFSRSRTNIDGGGLSFGKMKTKMPEKDIKPKEKAPKVDEILEKVDEMSENSFVCRICLGDSSEEESGNPLISPCFCDGTMKYIHQDCLKEWL